MSPTHTQPPPAPVSLGLTAHLEWSWLVLKENVCPGLRSLMFRTFQSSEQSEERMPVERIQNWTKRSDWRVGATHAWYRSDEGDTRWMRVFCFFFTFFIASKLYECSKNIQGHKDRKGLGLEKTSFRLSCTVVKRGSFGKADEVCPTLWGECHAAIGHRFGMWKEFIFPISFATKSSERRHLGCQRLWDAAVIHIRLIDLQLFSCGAKVIRFKENHTL